MTDTITIVQRDGRLYVRGPLATPRLAQFLGKSFSYPDKNAFFIRKASHWDGIHRLFNDRDFSVGLGFKNRLERVLHEFAQKNGLSIEIKHEGAAFPSTKNKEKVNATCPIVLRDYQQEAITRMLTAKVGILELATGAGKTAIAAELTRQLNTTTLFIVDRKELMDQATKAFEKVLGIKVGNIGDGISDVKPITIGMLQTLFSQHKKYESYLNTIEVLFVDECHISSAPTVRKTVGACKNAKYKIGLSATPWREDGNDMMIEEGLGEVVYTVNLKRLVSLGYATPPTIVFYELSGSRAGADEYANDYTFSVVQNEERERALLSVVGKYASRKIIILTKQVEHGARIQSLIPGSIHIHGSLASKKRKEDWKNFLASSNGVCVATISIAGKGLDIPDLGVIINASGNKSDINSLQTLGRVVRALDGKKDAFYIDFIDTGIFTRRHSKERIKCFEQEGHDVKIIKIEEQKKLTEASCPTVKNATGT